VAKLAAKNNHPNGKMRFFPKKGIRLPYKRIVCIVAASIFLAVLVSRALETLGPIISPFVASGGALSEEVKSITTQTVITAINDYRQSMNLTPFTINEDICGILEAIPTDPNETKNEDVFNACPNCSRIALLSISKHTGESDVLPRLQESDSRKILDDTQYTAVCAKEKEEFILAVFASFETKPTPVITSKTTPAPEYKPKNFSEDQMWQALVNYRTAHGKSNLNKDENLCVYARKRIEDQLSMLKSTKKDAYPNPDKYPLDAHAGFERDADSGYVFEVTHKNRVAENLAYWPDAQYPHQVIEWGWDTSTEGHRETQLSNEYTDACISGKDGFYVAIFGI
jgi:hypothetical protein